MIRKKDVINELVAANEMIQTLRQVCDAWEDAFNRANAQAVEFGEDVKRLKAEIDRLHNPEPGEQFVNEVLRLRKIVEMQGAAIRKLHRGQGPYVAGDPE